MKVFILCLYVLSLELCGEFGEDGVMDVLSDILSLSGVEKSALIHHSLYQPWAMRFPCDKSMGFHVVTQGEMYVRGAFLKEPLLMKKGDILLISRGHNHEISTDLKTKPQRTMAIGKREPAESARALATFASGVYTLKDAPIHILLAEMPDKILLRSDQVPAHDPLQSALQLLSAELSLHQMGSESVTRNLLDILFHYIWRKWLDLEEGRGQTWRLALRDPHLLKVLKAIHAAPEKPWSVDGMAATAGLSRAAFAKKFKAMIGETPAQYVTSVRVQKAARFFRSGALTVDEVARSVGFQDPFVFSKVFKRLQGVSPRDFRRQIRAESDAQGPSGGSKSK